MRPRRPIAALKRLGFTGGREGIALWAFASSAVNPLGFTGPREGIAAPASVAPVAP